MLVLPLKQLCMPLDNFLVPTYRVLLGAKVSLRNFSMLEMALDRRSVPAGNCDQYCYRALRGIERPTPWSALS